MAIKETVEIPLGLKLEKLDTDIKTAEGRIARALDRIDKSKKIQLKVETALSEQKLSTIKTIHERLVKNFEKKLALDVDVKSLDAAKKRVEDVEKILKRYKTDSSPDGKVAKSDSKAPEPITMKGMLKTAGALYGVSAGVSQIKDAVQVYNDFDTKMRNVNTNINVSQQELSGYSQKVLDLSVNLGKPAAELADAMYQATSAGMGAAESIGFVEIASKAATAGLTTTVTAVDGITSVLNAYQMSASDAGKVSDIMFTTVRLGKTTFEQMSRQISDITPLASSLGVNFEDVAAAIATMTKQGVPTEKATTQIRTAMQAMTKVLGDGWAKTMTFQEGLIKLREKAQGSDNKLQSLIGSVEGVGAVLALTGKNAAMAAADLEEMRNSSGATEKAFAMQADSMATKINKINASFDKAKISLVEIFAPAVGWVMDQFSEGLDRILGKVDNLDKVLKKDKSDHIKNYADTLKGTTKVFRDYELSEVQLQINDDQKKYNDLINKKTFLGISVDGEEINRLRISLAEARNYRQALKEFKEEVIPDKDNTVKGNKTNKTTTITTGTSTKPPKKLVDEKITALKSYYDEVKFLDENYLAYREKQIDDESVGMQKAGLSELQVEKWKLEEKKKLFDEYLKYLVNNGIGEIKGFQSPAISGQPTKIKGIPTELNTKTGGSENPMPFEGSTGQIIEEWVGATGIMRTSFDAVVSGVTEGLNLIKIRTADDAGEMEKIFADMGNMVIQQIKAIIAQWAVLNVLSFAMGGPGIGLSKMLGFHDGGAVRNGVKLAGGGGFTVPGGFPNDSFPLNVQSDELVKVYTPQQQKSNMQDYSQIVGALNVLNNRVANLMIDRKMSQGNQAPIHNHIYVDGKEVSKILGSVDKGLERGGIKIDY